MDNRIIENVKEYKQGLKLLKELKPSTYNLKGSKKNLMGLVSQDVQVLEPMVITPSQNGTLQVNYDDLIIILINAIKDLSTELDQLKDIKTKKNDKSK